MMRLVCLAILAVANVHGQETTLPPNDRPQIPEPEGTHVGELRGSEHSIAGSLYALDENILLLKRFEFDGEAKDTFFWVGTSSDTPNVDGAILPYPFGGVFYGSGDPNAPILYGVFNGSADLRLTLPPEIKVSELKWFSVWNRADKKSYAEVLFPRDFRLDSINTNRFGSVNQKNDEAVDFPRHETSDNDDDDSSRNVPPLIAHDPKRLEHLANAGSHDNDDDAEPKAEPETSADDDHHDLRTQDRFRPLAGSASSTVASFSVILVAILLAY